MEWTDDGIVIGVRRHGEASAIVDILTIERGRHSGLVRGGASSRLRPVLQPGNSVRAVWRARLDEHLGTFAIEGLRQRAAAWMTVPYALYGLNHLCALARLLPERDPHPVIYEALESVLDAFSKPFDAAALLARFELLLLAELGFGLDLEECAATGVREELVYVSPKSGRAVSREAGIPWADKLLRLPAFLADGDGPVTESHLADGFALTGFFLLRHVLEPRGTLLPEARAQFITAVMRVLRSNASAEQG